MITIRSALPAGKFRTTCHPWLHRGVTFQLERQANLQHPAGCATRPAYGRYGQEPIGHDGRADPASRPAHGATRSIYRELGQHHAPLVRPLGEASRRAEPEPASGRASKLWLPTARVVDIGYCGYSEPFGGAGEGHTGLRLGLASPYICVYADTGGKSKRVKRAFYAV